MLDNKELGAYLKKIREDKQLSLRQVDYKSSVSFSHLSMIENGSRKPTALTLKELANLYGVDYIDLYEKAGFIDLAEKERLEEKLKCDKQAFPLLGTVKAGYNYFASQNILGYVSIDKQLSDPENYFALQITGNSMEPILYEGDIVIVHRQSDVESGQVAIVLVDNEEGTIKKLIKHEDYIELVAFNSYYPPRRLDKNTKFEILGKVIEARINKIFE